MLKSFNSQAYKPITLTQEEIDVRYEKIYKCKAFEEFKARTLKAMQHESDLHEN